MGALDTPLWTLLIPSFLLIAILYSSVGHGGASGYLATLALTGFARPETTPVVLVLNILVAATAFVQYLRAGHFRLRLLLPFVVTSLPGAFIGGMIPVSEKVYAGLLGSALLAAAFRFLFLSRLVVDASPAGGEKEPTYRIGLPVGLLLGTLSGMVGVGGGIFLSPLLLLFHWADAKETAAVSSAFIVLNSLSGLAAHLFRGTTPAEGLLFPLAATVLIGGYIGSSLGAKRFSLLSLQRLLGGVLMIAGFKLFGKLW
ncbi:MAG: sulfite exporter TauE/SafE family protein [Candidatus Manganitrophaceae bacterium]